MIGLANLLLAGPAVAVRESIVLPLAFLVRLNHSILLKLNQTAFRVPRLHAAKHDNILQAEDAVLHKYPHVIISMFFLFIYNSILVILTQNLN